MSTNRALERITGVRSLLETDAYSKRFHQILGSERAPQFMASIVNVSRDLGDVDPNSIITAAIVAATLDLPIDRNLGFAWIVPYKGKGQFQMGYKGYIQLALRSNQYQRLNAVPVNEGGFLGRDPVGEPVIDWEFTDLPDSPVIGYVVAWRLTNGFIKVIYWSKEKVLAHARRFSQAYKAGKKDSPWFTDFDSMALKTVIMNGLKRWGILSIEMRGAFERDQTVQTHIDVEPERPDDVTTDPQKSIEANGTKAEQLAKQIEENRRIREVGGEVIDMPTKEDVSTTQNAENAGDDWDEEVERRQEEKEAAGDDAGTQGQGTPDETEQKRIHLHELFDQATELMGKMTISEKLETATGFRKPERVKPEKLGVGIEAVKNAITLFKKKNG